MKTLSLSFVVAVGLGCHHQLRAPAGADVLVIAPHPDDEVLMAGGVIAQAVVRGQRVEVVIVTNGDLTCERDGARRQAESLSALAELGVASAQVHFLGFADGQLSKLRTEPLDVERASEGACRRWATTGLRRVPAPLPSSRPLTADALTEDLEMVLTAFAPRDVYLPHGVDLHADHAMTYVFFRRALDRRPEAPVVHRSLVHAKGCWPAERCEGPLSLDTPMPPLPRPFDGYSPDERVAVDARAKLRWLSRYASQLDGPLELDWLSSFARTDEVFFTERYEKRRGRWLTQNAVLDLEGASATSRAKRGAFIERCTWSSDFAGVVLERAN